MVGARGQTVPLVGDAARSLPVPGYKRSCLRVFPEKAVPFFKIVGDKAIHYPEQVSPANVPPILFRNNFSFFYWIGNGVVCDPELLLL